MFPLALYTIVSLPFSSPKSTDTPLLYDETTPSESTECTTNVSYTLTNIASKYISSSLSTRRTSAKWDFVKPVASKSRTGLPFKKQTAFASMFTFLSTSLSTYLKTLFESETKSNLVTVSTVFLDVGAILTIL